MSHKTYRAIIATPGPNSNGDVFPPAVLEKVAKTGLGTLVRMGIDADSPVIGEVIDMAVINGNLEACVKLKDWTPKAGDWLGYVFQIGKVECSECHKVFESDTQDFCDHLKKKRTDQSDSSNKRVFESGAHEISLDATLQSLNVYPPGCKPADPKCKIIGEDK